VLAGVATEPVASLLNREEPGSLRTRLLLIAALILLSGSLLRQIRRRRSGTAGR